MNQGSQRESLSSRELEIARAYATDETYRQIADRLCLSPATVRTHLQSAYRKLDVHSKTALAREILASDATPGHTSLAARRISPSGFPILSVGRVRTSDDRQEIADLAGALERDLATYLGGSRWLTASLNDVPPDGVYVLDCNLLTRHDRLRLEARLVSPGREQVMHEKFDGTLGDSFEWQDQAAEAIAAETLGRLFVRVKRQLALRPFEELSASECVIYGFLQTLLSGESFIRALTYYEAAIQRDVGSGIAHAAFATTLYMARMCGYGSKVEPFLPRLEAALAGAERLLDDCGWRFLVELIRSAPHPDKSELRRLLQDGLRQWPFDFELLFLMGWNFNYLGSAEVALECFGRCQRLARQSVFRPASDAGIANALVQLARDADAADHARACMEELPEYPAAHRALAAALSYLGRQEEARKVGRDLMALVGNERVSEIRAWSGYVDREGPNRYLQGLLRSGWSD